MLDTHCICFTTWTNDTVYRAPHTPDMLNLNVEPQVTNKSTSVEGLVTWTLVRARRRLRKMQAAGNIGGCMRYSQIQRWLETCLCHLPTSGSYMTATGSCNLWLRRTHSQMMMKSPTAGMGDDEKHQQPWGHPPMSGEASGT